jgi:2-polyprenyl-6-hydroxyphenyl methylase/3-demethylubiquinone-9 3-methyltransferase
VHLIDAEWEKRLDMANRIGSLAHRFFAANARVCGWIERPFSHVEVDVVRPYEEEIARFMGRQRRAVVVDIGTGRECRFAKYRPANSDIKIIGVDVSEEAMQHNWQVDEKRVADVARTLPFDPAEVDVIASHSVLEHLEDVEAFVSNSARVVRPGGQFIHVFASKFAPSAILNQLLPHWAARRIVHFVRPGSEGTLGFRAYYDRCYPSAMTALLERHGFTVVSERVSYYQSEYFSFFVPVFLFSLLYEAVVSRLGAKNLAARVLVVATRASEASGAVSR